MDRHRGLQGRHLYISGFLDARQFFHASGPALAATGSQINRLTATLEEVAAKVTALIALPARSQQADPAAVGEVQGRDSAASSSAATANPMT
ncbi:hypothetical protein EN933_03665 [Mesorhizobium sp. M7A.F.Ca.US.001.01.1.1]|nr:hypothetical protein EN933_03665 [Mesorhizobium sp. M7A.F.Ca.US.001.01.1.1]